MDVFCLYMCVLMLCFWTNLILHCLHLDFHLVTYYVIGDTHFSRSGGTMIYMTTALWGSWKKSAHFGTLECDFSTDFHPRWVKFWLKLSKLPRNWKKWKNWRRQEKNGEKDAKNLLLVFVKVKLGVKKSVLVQKTFFVKQTFLTNTSK